MSAIPHLRARLAAHAPQLIDARRRAAVAVVVRATDAGDEMLFIERAERRGDPWSGHMAFPGGRVDPTDVDALAAALRETHEEVGLDLAGAERLGRLDDLHAGVRLVSPMALSAFVFRIENRPSLALNHEVREALWVPVDLLHDPVRHVGYRVGPMRYPGILVGEPDRHVVWGLTYRLLEGLFRIVDRPLPTGG